MAFKTMQVCEKCANDCKIEVHESIFTGADVVSCGKDKNGKQRKFKRKKKPPTEKK